MRFTKGIKIKKLNPHSVAKRIQSVFRFQVRFFFQSQIFAGFQFRFGFGFALAFDEIFQLERISKYAAASFNLGRLGRKAKVARNTKAVASDEKF